MQRCQDASDDHGLRLPTSGKLLFSLKRHEGTNYILVWLHPGRLSQFPAVCSPVHSMMFKMSKNQPKCHRPPLRRGSTPPKKETPQISINRSQMRADKLSAALVFLSHRCRSLTKVSRSRASAGAQARV